MSTSPKTGLMRWPMHFLWDGRPSSPLTKNPLVLPQRSCLSVLSPSDAATRTELWMWSIYQLKLQIMLKFVALCPDWKHLKWCTIFFPTVFCLSVCPATAVCFYPWSAAVCCSFGWVYTHLSLPSLGDVRTVGPYSRVAGMSLSTSTQVT